MVDRNFLLAVNRISGALTAVSVVFWLFGGIDFVKEPWALAVLSKSAVKLRPSGRRYKACPCFFSLVVISYIS